MDRTIGLLGGGQLGQMLCEAALPLGIKVVILDVGHSPAKQVNARNAHLDGKFTDAEKIRELARQCDVLTVEIEHVDTEILEEVAESGVMVSVDGETCRKTVEVQPSWKTLRTIQDKYLQKEHLISNGVAVASSVPVEARDLDKVGSKLGYPFMLKARKDAYDGRGNFPVRSEADLSEAREALKGRALYAEKWARFRMELAVMVVKTDDSGDLSSTMAYPAVETIHEDSICKLVYAPARGISEDIKEKAQHLARKAVSCLWGRGVFGVEMFLMDDDTLLVNEIAPRPHNSGHYTIEACPLMSQYKAQLLSVLDIMPRPTLPGLIPSVVPAAIMLNILGGAQESSHHELRRTAMTLPNANVHMYGKASKPARKIGHITVIADRMAEAEKTVEPLISMADGIRAERVPGAKSSSTPSSTTSTRPNPSSTSSSTPKPLVAVTMGSDSDLPTLKPGLDLLAQFDIPTLTTITSAHRTPQRMIHFAETAASRGLKVIIAAAGGAAHLPGMIASSTTLPVIGVPVKASTLDGMDSLLSIVQMPRGVPVATMAIGNSINAALLAIRILALADPDLKRRMEKYIEEMESGVVVKAERMEEVGYAAYKAP